MTISAKKLLGATLVVVMTSGIGACAQPARRSEMSAEEHRREAAKVTAEANREANLAEHPGMPPTIYPTNGAPPPVGANTPATMPPVSPNSAVAYGNADEHLSRAAQLREHAEQHLAAASELEAFEEQQCKSVPVSARAACPMLGAVVSIGDIPGGVRVRFTEGTSVDAVYAHMQCHLAFAEARGFGKAAGCPLYIRGISFRRPQEPRSIDIVGPNTKVAADIRRLSRAEAQVVHRDKR